MRKLEEWIEYMEGEGDLEKMGQLGLLLKHSLEDQVVLNNLRRLRRMIELTDPSDIIEDQISNSDFLGQFHQKTMKSIIQMKNSRRGKRGGPLASDEDQKTSLGSCKT